MFAVTKNYDHNLGLSACFRQHRASSHCQFLHGYALAFKIEFVADTLDHNNWVLDFGGLKPVKAYLEETFDHRMLVAQDDPHLDELTGLAGLGIADPLVVQNVGCEAFAHMVFDFVNAWMTAEHQQGITERGLRLASVECREHAGNSAIYFGGA